MADASGRTLGKYELQERIGRGGMAEVYRAHQPGLERSVAVKILHAHLADAPDFIQRFQREAQAVAQLRHPSIVQVFDFDLEGETHYMAMEFIAGQTLKTRLDELFTRNEHLPVSETFRIFHALLEAVEYAHAQGIAHRDLKPANIMLTDSGRVILTDFGIARLMDGQRLTLSGLGVGTPAYMSPEQGDGQPGDERSDIYALGVLLYECLVGNVPFESDSTVGVLLKHQQAPVPTLSEARPDLPPVFDAIIHRALAKKPKDRYQTARALLEALSAIEVAAQDTTHSRLQIIRRRRWPRRVWLSGGALALVALTLWGVTRFSNFAFLDPALAQGQAQLSAGNYQLAVDQFNTSLTRTPDNAEALLGRARAYEQLGQVTESLADVELMIARAPNQSLGYEERARLTAQYTGEVEAALADLDHAVTLAPDAQAARAYFLRGWVRLNFTPAPDLALVITDLQRATQLDTQNAEAQFTLARAYLAQPDLSSARAAATRAMNLDATAPLYAKLRAHIAFAENDYYAALDDLTLARSHATDPVEQATLNVEQAFLLLKLNDLSAARSAWAQAQTLAPASRLVQYMALVLDPAQPRPTGADLQLARAAVSDDPIWQAIVEAVSP